MVKTLHLVVKHKWFDMIASGEKLEEYRAFKPYWTKRLYGIKTLDTKSMMQTKPIAFDSITFHRGYTSTTIERVYKGLTVDMSRPEWSENGESKWCYVLLLGGVFDYQAFIRIKTELLLEDVEGNWGGPFVTPEITKDNVMHMTSKLMEFLPRSLNNKFSNN